MSRRKRPIGGAQEVHPELAKRVVADQEQDLRRAVTGKLIPERLRLVPHATLSIEAIASEAYA